MTISIGLAFLAGLASFFSPCVFSLVPVYIGYLSGRTVASSSSGKSTTRFDTFTHGLAFVFGFSLVFVLLGVSVSAVGALLYDFRDIIAKVGGVIIIIFGLQMAGIIHIPFFEYDLRPKSDQERQRGYLSSALFGIFFSAGWSPCVGPVLSSILMLAMNEGSVDRGIQMLTAYSVGMAVPFLIAALGIDWVINILRNHSRTMHIIEISMGVVMIGVGLLLIFGIFAQLSYYGLYINFGL